MDKAVRIFVDVQILVESSLRTSAATAVPLHAMNRDLCEGIVKTIADGIELAYEVIPGGYLS